MNCLKTTLIALAIFSLAGTGWAAPAVKTERPVIVAASGTSSSEGSSPVTCLLDPQCQGYWSPQSKDAGSNEGLYLRFKEPIHFNFIEITTEEPLPEAVDFQLFLDAHSSQRLGVVKAEDSEAGNDSVKIIGISLVSGGDGIPAKYLVRSILITQDDDAWNPLDYQGQSIFIKLAPQQIESKNQAPPKVVSIRFFDQKEWPGELDQEDPAAAPMDLELPVPVTAKAEASSTLEPAFAYDVSKLFDSQPDMAWSANGKKSNGIGESITLNFESEQDIHGLMLWNGYQRSDTHYKANGRVKALKLAGQTVRVKDVQGSQVVRLPMPIKANEVKLEISEIYPGGSYPDVLISELRFLGAQDRVLLPQVPAPAPEASAALQQTLDQTFVPILHEVGPFETGPGGCDDEDCIIFDSTMRLRSNGSFVIYANDWNEGAKGRSSIVEGNWEPQGDDTLRLFGKKYQTPIWGSFSTYLRDGPKAKKEPAPRIFQSVMKVARFASLSEDEQENAVRYMLQSKWVNKYDNEAYKNGLPEDGRTGIVMHVQGHATSIGGPDRETAVKNIAAKLREIDPLYVKSDVYTEIVLPRQADINE